VRLVHGSNGLCKFRQCYYLLTNQRYRHGLAFLKVQSHNTVARSYQVNLSLSSWSGWCGCRFRQYHFKKTTRIRQRRHDTRSAPSTLSVRHERVVYKRPWNFCQTWSSPEEIGALTILIWSNTTDRVPSTVHNALMNTVAIIQPQISYCLLQKGISTPALFLLNCVKNLKPIRTKS
jgi:hypothetical protein